VKLNNKFQSTLKPFSNVITPFVLLLVSLQFFGAPLAIADWFSVSSPPEVSEGVPSARIDPFLYFGQDEHEGPVCPLPEAKMLGGDDLPWPWGDELAFPMHTAAGFYEVTQFNKACNCPTVFKLSITPLLYTTNNHRSFDLVLEEIDRTTCEVKSKGQAQVSTNLSIPDYYKVIGFEMRNEKPYQMTIRAFHNNTLKKGLPAPAMVYGFSGNVNAHNMVPRDQYQIVGSFFPEDGIAGGQSFKWQAIDLQCPK
jgi:hypothetical protein